MDNTVSEWLAISETDLGVARYLYENYHPKSIEIICYHCQQSAEKAIKAIIIANGAPGGMPKLHDLSFLLNQIKNMMDIDDKFYEYADTLTPYGVSARYPNELFLEDRHAATALAYASEILQWAKITCKRTDC